MTKTGGENGTEIIEEIGKDSQMSKLMGISIA
jgi:hypothetical protein